MNEKWKSYTVTRLREYSAANDIYLPPNSNKTEIIRILSGWNVSHGSIMRESRETCDTSASVVRVPPVFREITGEGYEYLIEMNYRSFIGGYSTEEQASEALTQFVKSYEESCDISSIVCYNSSTLSRNSETSKPHFFRRIKDVGFLDATIFCLIQKISEECLLFSL